MAQITTYTVDAAKRRIITVENMEELGITDSLIQALLTDKKITESQKYKVDEKGNYLYDSKNQLISLSPVGVSINDKKFGNFPDPNAAQRGWMSFLEIGAPLFEERSNIIQPIADVISTRTYDNRSNEARTFSDTIQFTVGNTINWSLSGTGHANFGGSIAGELQGAISKTLETVLTESLANSLAKNNNNTITQTVTQTNNTHNHKDNIGTSSSSATATAVANQVGITATTTNTSTNSNRESFTGSGYALGRGELSAELGLALTGTISGTVTTTWSSSSNVAGTISANSRVETLATQRRQVKQFTYEIPITFDGYIGLNYNELVLPPNDANGPLSTFGPAKVIPARISVLNLVDTNKLYRAKGMAETVSALDVNHAIFDTKTLNRDNSQKFGTARPHNL